MDYNAALDFFLINKEAAKSDGSSSEAMDTPRGPIRDVGTFRSVNAAQYEELKEVREVLKSLQSICLLTEKIAAKYGIVFGEYCLIAASEQSAQSQTKGLQMDFSDGKEYLFKVQTIPSNEDLDKMEDIILLPHLAFDNLGITEGAFLTIRKMEDALDDKAIQAFKTKKDFPLRIAKKVCCKLLINKYQKYATHDLIHTLLMERPSKVINKHETIVLNFYNKICENLFSKLNKAQRCKFLRLNSQKLTTPSEDFILIIKVIKDIEPHTDSKNTNANNYSPLGSAFLLDPTHTSISIENAPYNAFLPRLKLPISTHYSPEFLNTIFSDSYLSKVFKKLDNLINVAIQNREQLSQSKVMTALSYPHGIGISLLLKKMASQYGLNYVEKNVCQCYSLQEVENRISKGIFMRPSIILLKRFTHMKVFLDQKASISHSNSLSSYVEHLAERIRAVAMQNPDNLPCLIVLAENQKEKVEQVYAEASEMLKYVVHIDQPTEIEHANIVKTLLKWFNVTIDDMDELKTCSKGLSWKQVYKILKEQSQKEPESQFLVQNFKKKVEDTKKESNVATSLNIPNVTWQDVGGLVEAKNEIIDTIMLPQWYPQLFQNKIKPRTGILFFGPPGTGKTMLAKAVANECKMNFMSVKGPEVLNMYVGESEKNVREIFDKARSNLPCIIFFDELDALVPNRGHGSDSSQVMERIVAQFLTEVDGLQKEGGLFIIGATNRPDLLDDSLLRPGRFDKMVYLGINEDKDSRLKILQAQTRKFNLSKDVDFDSLEEKIPKNFTGADFYALTSGAILRSVKRKIASLDEMYLKAKESEEDIKTFEEWPRGLAKEILDVEVSNEDFLDCLAGITPSVSSKELKKYEELRKKYALN